MQLQDFMSFKLKVLSLLSVLSFLSVSHADLTSCKESLSKEITATLLDAVSQFEQAELLFSNKEAELIKLTSEGEAMNWDTLKGILSQLPSWKGEEIDRYQSEAEIFKTLKESKEFSEIDEVDLQVMTFKLTSASHPTFSHQ